MSRLTKKEKWINPFTNVEFNYKVINSDLVAIEKLGKIEDFEEILGCPLDVVFKALNGIYCPEFEENEEIKHYYVYGFNKSNLLIKLIYDEYDDYCNEETSIPLKKYQKTWWLKGEKVE